MKIYTKTGDMGETGLYGGGRVSKNDPRVAAYGGVDELNAALGMALALKPETFARELLERIQRDLFTIGAELATPDPTKLAKALKGGPLTPEATLALETEIDGYQTRLPPLKNFILPGGVPKAAALHAARTVCRRAERAVVALGETGAALSPHILPYVNRLSDLLFVLARAANAAAGVPDVPW